MITPKRLFKGTQLAATISTLYTATNVRTIIDKITGCNTTAGAITVDIHLVASGDSADDTNKVVDAYSIAANTTYTFPEVVGHILEQGGTIQAHASAATSVSLRASGREVS